MNLISFGLFGIIFLIILAIVSNSSEDSQIDIQRQMFLMNCPLPIYNGDVTNLDIIGFSVNYTVTYYQSITNFNGTFFECSYTPNPDPDLDLSVNAISKEYDSTLFSVIPIGWYGYLADFLVTIFARLEAMFILIGFYVTPTGFNILGYTINDLSGTALLVVIGIYGLCYVAIGIMMYKILSPFSGVG